MFNEGTKIDACSSCQSTETTAYLFFHAMLNLSFSKSNFAL